MGELMGKDLQGNELGVGITQRTWGSYSARYTDSNGVRIGRNFKTVDECRAWIERSVIEDKYIGKLRGSAFTVQKWFRYYIDIIKKPVLKERTVELYIHMFNRHIKSILGRIKLTAVQPLHCQRVLDVASRRNLADVTIEKVRTVMHDMFGSAYDYDYIASNPVWKSVRIYRRNPTKERVVLNVSEQKAFLEEAAKFREYPAFALILQTGMRIGELSALQWRDIDFQKKMIHVNRTGSYRNGEFRVNSPKTPNSRRKIPMTRKSEELLTALQDNYSVFPSSPHKEEGYIFINSKGMVTRQYAYQKTITHIRNTLGIPGITIHGLRHTFATRCIEAGMRPKTLQVLLGHASVAITMNLYVHVTQEQKEKEVNSVADRILCMDGEEYGAGSSGA